MEYNKVPASMMLFSFGDTSSANSLQSQVLSCLFYSWLTITVKVLN